MRTRIVIGAALAALLALPASWAGTAEIPAHPRDLKYGPLKFDVPDPAKYSFKLKNGIKVYIAEDHSLPLVDVQITVRTGEFVVPLEKTGLAQMTASLMRDGGAGDMTAEQFDEKADFLAAGIGSFAGDTQAGVSLDALSGQLEPSLDLLFAMLKSPRFQEDRIEVEKSQRLERMKQRNDDAGDIIGREWGFLLYGEQHFAPRVMTKAQLESITRDDMIAFHKAWWRPENMLIAVSGDVSKDAILAALDARFAGWKPAGPTAPWPPKGPDFTPAPGLYHVEKDIPQAKVYIGHLGTQWDAGWSNPDNFALSVMNDVLGGGGFTSRITKRIRSDEGLAYSAGSSFGIGDFWPGTFRVSFQTKSSTVAYAAKLALTEIEGMQNAPVTEEELNTAKNSFIETFPRRFENKGAIVRLFTNDDYVGRPHDYWRNYRDNYRKVTAADVQRVAKRYLKPDQFVYLIVGKWADIAPGDPDGKATMKEFFGGQVKELPLRDPMTMQPMP